MALWKGKERWVGVIPCLIAFLSWGQDSRPDVLIADTGGLVGVLTDEGRALSKEKGSGFIATVWLENDGDGSDQKQAAGRWPANGDRVQRFSWHEKELVHIAGKRAAREFDECKKGQLIVSSVPVQLTGNCSVYDPDRLAQTGSLALYADQTISATAMIGRRLWSPKRDGDQRNLKDQ